MSVTHLVPGPERHGVVRHALGLLGRPALAGHAVVRGTWAAGPGLRHGHLTDHLWGGPEAAVEQVRALARVGPVSLTLHDLPQPGEGEERVARRARAYAQVAALAVGVIVASRHEEEALRAACAVAGVEPPREVHVVPLPVDVAAGVAGARSGAGSDAVGRGSTPVAGRSVGVPGRSVGVPGYLYPGKGHLETLRAMRGLPADVAFVALGGPSAGHDWLVDDLRAEADRQGRELVVTGWLEDDALVEHARAVGVPVAAPLHASASGSLGAWLAAGRRPVASAHPFHREVAERSPGAVALVEREELPRAIADALAEPSDTWWGPQVRVGPSTDEVARRYAALLETWAAS